MLHHALGQATGDVTRISGDSRRMGLADRGRVARWLASRAAAPWWDLAGIEQSRALASRTGKLDFVEAVRETLGLDADEHWPGELEERDRAFLREALEVLEELRQVPGQPNPRRGRAPASIRSAAEEAVVSEETTEQAPAERVGAVAEALVDGGYAEYYREVAHAAGIGEAELSKVRHGRKSVSEERATALIGRLEEHFDVVVSSPLRNGGPDGDENAGGDTGDDRPDPVTPPAPQVEERRDTGPEEEDEEIAVPRDDPRVSGKDLELRDEGRQMPTATISSAGAYLQLELQEDGTYRIDASLVVGARIAAELRQLAVEQAFGTDSAT